MPGGVAAAAHEKQHARPYSGRGPSWAPARLVSRGALSSAAILTASPQPGRSLFPPRRAPDLLPWSRAVRELRRAGQKGRRHLEVWQSAYPLPASRVLAGRDGARPTKGKACLAHRLSQKP